MEAFLNALAQYLIDNGIITPLVDNGGSTYLLSLPEHPDDVTVIKNYDTTGSNLYVSTFGVRRVQFVVRNKSKQQAMNSCDKIFAFLQQDKSNSDFFTNIDDKYEAVIQHISGPIDLGPDENGRALWSLNYAITVKLI